MPVYTYDEALAASIEYFNGNTLAASVFLDKYALRDKEQNIVEKTPTDMHKRIAKEFARIEKKKFKTPLSEEEIFGLIDKFKFVIPQGSPMSGIGNDSQIVSLSNCFVVQSPLDSYGSICKTDEELAQISKRRGGNGADISNLRPAGTPTQNAARSSTGIVSFSERFSNTIREVGQAGRRGALMLSCHVLHPQSRDFATMKNDDTKVTGANISLRLVDEFMQAVVDDTDVTLRWPVDSKIPTITKIVNAKELWNTIINSAWMRAEPGLLFWDNIIRNSPADCYEQFKTISTNPCGEIPLSAYDSCRLIAINLFGCVKNPYTKKASFDFEKFHKIAGLTQRLMDDMVDLEEEKIHAIIAKIKSDPEPAETKSTELSLWKRVLTACVEGRRTGTGITALGDTLAALGIKYGSDESIDMTEQIYRALKLGAYESSVDMAEELGAFPVWNFEKEKDNEFLLRIKEESPKLYDKMSKVGRRNIALLTTAPTGSLSMLALLINRFGTSSGIEPLYTDIPYTRKKKINPDDQNTRVDSVDQNGDSWQDFRVYPPSIDEYIDVSKDTELKNSPYAGAVAEVLDWKQRVRLQAAAQRHVDHSISSTVNLPNNVTEDKVAEIYIEAWKSGCKGMTVYRDGCRTGVLVKDVPKVEVPKGIEKTFPPKRPDDLPCDVHHATVEGEKYFVVVGFYEGDVYEVFTGLNKNEDGFTVVPKSVTKGNLSKKGRKNYTVVADDESYRITTKHSNHNADALTRIISTALRHGADISFIVHQLEKTEGTLWSFAKVIARTLKKYIPDGTEVKGDSCPSCHSANLQRSEGCVICKDCGHSKCG